MQVLFFRNWQTQNHSATFSTLETTGVGGTEYQLLNHAQFLTELGHKVYVAGASSNEVEENGVIFLATPTREYLEDQLKIIGTKIDAVWVNTTDNLDHLRSMIPQAVFVQISQNGPHFKWESYLDFFAMVGYGQMAYYLTQYPQYRQKIVPLVNVPSWERIYGPIRSQDKKHQLIWVGEIGKQGLRQWGKALVPILKNDSTLMWILCVHSYNSQIDGNLPEALRGLDLPMEQLEFKNFTLPNLAKEIASSKMLLGSLGGEDGPITYLDGHAAGIPVLCGDDIIGKWYNLEGMGYRITTSDEGRAAIEKLLSDNNLAEEMGKKGREWISLNYTEKHLRFQVNNLIMLCEQIRKKKYWSKSSVQSDRKFSWRYWIERLDIKFER